MSENAITRRSFLAGSAGVAAVAAGAGFVSFKSWERASADEEASVGATTTAYSLCGACPNKCGFTGYVVDGSLDKMIGDTTHPVCEGTLCACGYGYASVAYSQDRLTDPLKKNESGQFEAITWDEAYSEIATKVANIISTDGPGALALIYDPEPTSQYYAPRFMNALKSPNVYAHGAPGTTSKSAGLMQAIGAESYESDVANAKMTMFIGYSAADTVRPNMLHAMQQAHEAGARIVMVDSRCTNGIAFADEWIPVRPGTDLAFVLAVARVLVKKELYDADYVAQNATGLDEWEEYLSSCTTAWASEICGVDEIKIEQCAIELAAAAPAASIEIGWDEACGGYANAGETARAIALVNTLLGCWNQEGGALILPSVAPGNLDGQTFPTVPTISDEILGSAAYTLALDGSGLAAYAIDAAKRSEVKGLFFCNTNVVAECSNAAYLSECVEDCTLSVAIDIQMNETCMACDYGLPDSSYLERLESPEFIAAKMPAVALRNQVIEKVHENTRPTDQIFTELAEACGVGSYFDFSVEELADAQLETVGLSLAALRKSGLSTIPESRLVYGQTPVWNTPSGKIEFASEACEEGGVARTPEWIEPANNFDDIDEEEFLLIGGEQSIHSRTKTTDVETLINITEDYHLESAWMNTERAEALGISDGDTIVIQNNIANETVRVHVTQRIVPWALYVPSHYGCSSSDLANAYGIGLRLTDFVTFGLEGGYGGSRTQGVVVKARKVGA